MKKILLTTVLGFGIAMNAMADTVLSPEDAYLCSIKKDAKGKKLETSEVEKYLEILSERNKNFLDAARVLDTFIEEGRITASQKRKVLSGKVKKLFKLEGNFVL